MGALSIGYAKRAGYEVITTASTHHFELLKDLGADHIFDRAADDVVDKMSKLLPIQFWFDTVSLPDSVQKMIDLAMIQRESEAKEIHLLMLLPPTMPGLPTIPEGIRPQMMFFRGKADENKEHVEWLLGKGGYLERGLQGGWIRGVPSEVIGGLDAVHQGVKDILAGVSGRKLIIDPWIE